MMHDDAPEIVLRHASVVDEAGQPGVVTVRSLTHIREEDSEPGTPRPAGGGVPASPNAQNPPSFSSFSLKTKRESAGSVRMKSLLAKAKAQSAKDAGKDVTSAGAKDAGKDVTSAGASERDRSPTEPLGDRAFSFGPSVDGSAASLNVRRKVHAIQSSSTRPSPHDRALQSTLPNNAGNPLMLGSQPKAGSRQGDNVSPSQSELPRTVSPDTFFDDDDDDDDDDMEQEGNTPTSPTATDRKRAGSAAVGNAKRLNEEHPLIVALDVAYVWTSFIGCVLATVLIHPRGGLHDGPMLPWSAGVCVSIEVFTWIWIASRFAIRTRRGEWEILVSLKDIREQYMRSWFAYDVLYAFPIDLFFIGWNWPVFFGLQLRQLLRFVRIAQLGTSSNPLLGSRLWFQFMSVVCVAFFLMHLQASVFWYFEESQGYTECLYWATATMTSVGYGDIIPTTYNTRVYCCFAMLTGIVFIATMTAFATSFLSQQDKLTEETDAKKQMLHAMMAYYNIPWNVQLEVISMFPAVINKQNEQKFKEMSDAMPHFIAQKIEGYTRAKMLSVVPMFQKITDPGVVMLISSILKQRFFAAGEPIIEAGDDSTEMYFLIRGVVEVIITLAEENVDVVVACLRPGAFFGETVMLGQAAKRAATVQTVTLCELLVLRREDFESIVRKRPEVEKLFYAEARTYEEE
jgi:hypothetical protein